MRFLETQELNRHQMKGWPLWSPARTMINNYGYSSLYGFSLLHMFL